MSTQIAVRLADELVKTRPVLVLMREAARGRTIGFLRDDQEQALARALILAGDLEIPLLAE